LAKQRGEEEGPLGFGREEGGQEGWQQPEEGRGAARAEKGALGTFRFNKQLTWRRRTADWPAEMAAPAPVPPTRRSRFKPREAPQLEVLTRRAKHRHNGTIAHAVVRTR
jgi:hypothetical protein